MRKSSTLSKNIKTPLSKHQQYLWKDFLEENRYTSNEGVYHLIKHLYLEEAEDIRRVRKNLKRRIRKGINKQYLEEIKLLHNYLDHLIKALML